MTNSVMDKEGRVWIPEEMLRALGIDGPVLMTVEIDAASGTLVLRPGESVPEEDWDCYLPERRVRSKRYDPEHPGYQLSKEDWERLVEDPDFVREIIGNPKYFAEPVAAAVAGAWVSQPRRDGRLFAFVRGQEVRRERSARFPSCVRPAEHI